SVEPKPMFHFPDPPTLPNFNMGKRPFMTSTTADLSFSKCNKLKKPFGSNKTASHDKQKILQNFAQIKKKSFREFWEDNEEALLCLIEIQKICDKVMKEVAIADL